jgi:hypothetical protein
VRVDERWAQTAAAILDDVHDAGGELVNIASELVWVRVPEEYLREPLEARIREHSWAVICQLTAWCVGCRRRAVALPGEACSECRGSRPHVGVIGFGGGATVEHAITLTGNRVWLCGQGVLGPREPLHATVPYEGVGRRRLCSKCARELEFRNAWPPMTQRRRVPSEWWR